MNSTTQSEYYLLAADSSYPALEYRNPDYDLGRELCLYKHIELLENAFDLYLRKPLPQNPKLADYHILFGLRHVISERVKQVIEQTTTYKLDFLPAGIHLKDSCEQGYFILNAYNTCLAMDKQRSDWTKSSNPKPEREVLSIDKLVLDSSKIKNTPLNERIIFALGECTTYTLFHESVVRSIEKLKPKGMYAVPVDAWGSDVASLL